jgi:cyclopropane fatty-acyl-phospholipid synthase-like methyltransferase
MTTPTSGWDSAYSEDSPAPWDIGRPQRAFRRIADQGLLTGHLLDAGCGTGEHSLLAATCGAQVTGVDVSATAIGRARAKAAERGLSVRFEVASALSLAELGTEFDTIVDSGLFHVFDDGDRVSYVASLASAAKPGASLYLMCFSDRQPGDFGPRRVSQDELRAAFADGWSVDTIEAEAFEMNPGLPIPEARAWLATVRRK